MQGYTDNPVFGPTGNPWNPSLTGRRLVGRRGGAGGRGRLPDRAGHRRRRLDPQAGIAHQPGRLQAFARARAARGRAAADLPRLRGGGSDRAQRGRCGRGHAGDRARLGRGGERAPCPHPLHSALRATPGRSADRCPDRGGRAPAGGDGARRHDGPGLRHGRGGQRALAAACAGGPGVARCASTGAVGADLRCVVVRPGDAGQCRHRPQGVRGGPVRPAVRSRAAAQRAVAPVRAGTTSC